MTLDVSQANLENHTVLEVGSGRGDTTRRLADILSKYPRTRLIVTDIDDRHFDEIRRDICGKPVQVEFHQTGAGDLAPVTDGSIDDLVCHYTLCAINAQAGQLVLALRRFQQVLRPGGVLWIEEELPIHHAKGAAQEIWAEKWRILRAAGAILGQAPFQEIEPEVLSQACTVFGFTDCHWEADVSYFTGPDVLQFFQARLGRLTAGFPRPELADGFRAWEQDLVQRYRLAGAMAAPYYRFCAVKSTGEREAGH